MYIEMIDETGQVSEKLKEQTLELLDFAAQRLGKEDKEMAVTFVTNERSHELNLEYRDTDRPTDVISLEYKPELDISFDEEELAENPELAEMMGEFDSYIGELFISVDKAHEQAEDTTPCFYTQKTPTRYRTSRILAICADVIHRRSCANWMPTPKNRA